MRLKDGIKVIQFKSMVLNNCTLEFYGDSNILPVHKVNLEAYKCDSLDTYLDNIANKLLLKGYIDIEIDVRRLLCTIKQ